MLFLFVLISVDLNAQNFEHEYFFSSHFPYSQNMEKLYQPQGIQNYYYDSNDRLISKSLHYYNGLYDSTTYKYNSKDLIIEENYFKVYSSGLKITKKTEYVYNSNNDLDTKIIFDYYRFNGFAGYEKYYYQDKKINKQLTFGTDSSMIEKRIYKQISNNVRVDFRMNKEGILEQINKETYNDSGKVIKLELNFSPKDTADMHFDRTIEYKYKNDLIIYEDGVSFNYIFENNIWIYKVAIKNGKPISCIYRK